MTDHAWFQENIAGFVAGGLDAEERERFESHARECGECARDLAAARDFDRTLGRMFADAKPRPELEDSAIRALRLRGRRLTMPHPALQWLAGGIAAVALLGVIGTMTTRWIDNGTLAFPGREREARAHVMNGLKQLSLAVHDGSKSMVDDEPAGRDSSPGLRESAPPPSPPSDGSAINGTSRTLTAVGGEFKTFGMDSKKEAAMPNLPAGAGAATGVQAGDEPTFKLEEIHKNKSGNGRVADPKESTPGQSAPQNYYSYRDDRAGVVEGKGQGRGWSEKAGDKSNAANLGYFNPLLAFGEKDKEIKDLRGAPLGGKPGEPGNDKKGKYTFGTFGRQSDGKQDQFEIYRMANPVKPDPGTTSGTGKTVATIQKAPDTKPQPTSSRKVIRSGEIEFEITSFDSAVATVTRLVGAIKEGGFVATVNSEKLANGKVRGTVVVRVPPDALDNLVLDLRKELGKVGELKSQRIGSQDITKQYTDLESRLRAARAMEERLLQIIKSGKGEIKDLLNAEKELGNWRTKIEEFEGELRYYANQVSLSTLTITLTEKEIRAPYEIRETEQVKMSLEVEDADKAQREAIAAVTAAKGHILRSELKQHSAGQYMVVLEFAVAPESAAAVRDRLKQLGRVASLNMDRVLTAEGGTGPNVTAKRVQAETRFYVNMYNLTNVQPRETVILELASANVESGYKDVLARIQRANGKVVNSNLERKPSEQTQGTITAELKTADADAFLEAAKGLGEVVKLQVNESKDLQNTTPSKRGFTITLYGLGVLPPRETTTIQLAAPDVAGGYRAVQAALAKAKGRTLLAQLNEQDSEKVSAQLHFEVRREEAAAMEAALAAAGEVVSRQTSRAQENQQAIDSKVRLDVSFINPKQLAPRETFKLGLEVADVDQSVAAFASYVQQAKGRVLNSDINREADGRTVAQVMLEVPLASASEVLGKLRGSGHVRTFNAARNLNASEGKLATARIELTVANADLIVPSDQGIWPQVRKGLTTSFIAISWSLTVIIIGLLFVLPWAIVIYVIYLIVRRFRRRAASVNP